MNVGKPTRLETILDSLTTRLNAITGVPVEYIIPTLSEDWFAPGGLSDKYILITNFAGQEIPGPTDGAGTAGKLWNGSAEVVVVTRLDTDTPGSDKNRLRDSSFGLLAQWQKMLKALDQWMPDDGGAPAQGLLFQPSRTFGFVIRPRNYKSTNGWVQIRTRVHLPFVQDLS